jgi:hypothetical protein
MNVEQLNSKFQEVGIPSAEKFWEMATKRTTALVKMPEVKKIPAKEEFKVGDILDPQGKTNMVGRVKIREISGNTLKFVDSKGTEYAGMQRSLVRTLINEGSWKKVPETPIPKELQPLAEEARKYKSAEEFVENIINKKTAISKIEQKYAISGELSGKLTPEQIKFRKDYYDFFSTPEAQIKYKQGIGDKSQLTDFYNQAVKGVKPEIKKPVADITKLKERLEMAEGEVWMELDVAEAGKRLGIASEEIGVDYKFLAQKSTFPDWIPEHLREKPLVDKAMDYMTRGVRPVAGKLRELYDVVMKKVSEKAGLSAEELRAVGFEKPTEIKVKINLDKVRRLMAESYKRKVRATLRSLGLKVPERKIVKKETVLLRERLRAEARAGKKAVVAGRKEVREKIAAKKLAEKMAQREANQIKKQIGWERHTKELKGNVMQRLKSIHGIKEWKNAEVEQLNKVLADIKKLKKGDSFLTEKQITGLKNYIEVGNFGKDPRYITKREMIEKFKENEEIMKGAVTRFISNNAFPTVDIKEGHPVIKSIVNKSDIELREANKTIKTINEELDKLLNLAEKFRKGVSKKQVGVRIFQRMSGSDIELTAQELEVVDYLKNYFEQAKKDIGLQRYRKNYITHIEKRFMEKVFSKGVIGAIKDFMKPREIDIPLDIMLALDNIMGSEKFFRFALQRKGGLDPTTNIRRIFKEYSQITEVKKALDKILPKAQASQQLLLQNKSALWLKRYIQNLKGRALDFEFRSGKMGWSAKTADKIIDFGYFRLLGFNWRSAIKNIVGGETNSFAYQSFYKYLLGKKRFVLTPRKSYRTIRDMGVLEGSYVDIVRQNIIPRGKKFINHIIYGLMEAGEYEMRGSYLLGQMTKEEWKTGTLTPERFREILDGIAITQGLYTKTDSPLFVQTALGRSVMQFGRWKITNSLLVRRIGKGMIDEVKAGQYNGKNTRRFLKILITTGIGMYLSYEAGKAGYKNAKKFAEASAELVLTMVDLVTGALIYDALANNPALETLGSFVYTMQSLASYITFGIIEEPRQIEFKQGITDIYFSILRDLGIQGKKEEGIEIPSVEIGLPEIDIPEIDIEL